MDSAGDPMDCLITNKTSTDPRYLLDSETTDDLVDTRARVETPKSNKQQHIKASTFLGLPTELRILCYQYFVPNVDIIFDSYLRYENPSLRLRSDGGACTPAILGVSKQVYAEAIKEFYGNRIFGLEIVNLGGPMGFSFLDQEYLWKRDLPNIFFSVKKLNLRIPYTGINRDDKVQQINRILRHCFLERASCLESLHIEIEAKQPFLDQYLSPLKEVRGLSKVTMGCILHKSAANKSKTEMALHESQTVLLDEWKELMTLPLPVASS